MKYQIILIALSLGSCCSSKLHSNPLNSDEVEYDGNREPSLEETWGALWPFQGVNTFAHLDHAKCLIEKDETYDIGIIGVPFDTASSYRPGSRFGPRAIRAASQRQTSLRGYNQKAGINPYQNWAKIIDCDDIPVTPMDNSLAFKQMNLAFDQLISKRKSNATNAHPRYVALGGDHSVLLPHLRALHKIYGPLNVIHFDAHLDTWKPDKYPSFWHSDQSELNHGSMLWKAHEEGLLTTHNIHAGLRTKLSGNEDYLDDDEQNFTRIYADDVWIKGVDYVIKKILDSVPADTPTYLSVDIDVLDPGFGSGTGTQEPGGWLPRELIYVLRHIDGLSIVGADVVEVSPAFDNAEITSTNGAQVAFEIITSMVKKGKLDHLARGIQAKDLITIKETKKSLKEVSEDETGDKQLHKKLLENLEEVERLKLKLLNQLQQFGDNKIII
ncbi:uncharacterized protein PRCAT00002450001 [Priceomyces carsonii]|uniref:uncharacterized protein n=1 Tax=Priceomyces carsonii TaxID=28549 RepID=UPI002ED9E24C|nr:unnamed protein product [Priceomyces carsonii]